MSIVLVVLVSPPSSPNLFSGRCYLQSKLHVGAFNNSDMALDTVALDNGGSSAGKTQSASNLIISSLQICVVSCETACGLCFRSFIPGIATRENAVGFTILLGIWQSSG